MSLGGRAEMAGEGERETHRRGPVRGLGRGDLVQGVVGEPAAESRARPPTGGAARRAEASPPRSERRRAANAARFLSRRPSAALFVGEGFAERGGARSSGRALSRTSSP